MAGAALLTVARILTPDARGHGTHEQLGLPACPFRSLTGLPCPFCGMTTAFSHLARLEPLEAFRCQPAGAVLGILLAGAMLIATFDVITGRGWIEAAMGKKQLERAGGRAALLLAVMLPAGLLLAGWVYTLTR